MKLNEIIAEAEGKGLLSGAYYDESIPKSFKYTGELVAGLTELLKTKNASLLEDLLIIAEWDGLNQKYTNILIWLLKEDWHDRQEDIVMAMEVIKDPMTVEVLYDTAERFPSYDEGRSLTKKCIWALIAIGTEEAKDKIELLTFSKDNLVSQIAASELDWLKKR